MLKSYFSFSWLALQEYLPEKRRKWLKLVWIVTTFIVGSFIADFLGVPLINPVKALYRLLPTSYWIILLLLAVVVLKISIIEGARRVFQKDLWLRDLAQKDRQDLSAGIKITHCEVDIDTELDSGRGWVEFRFKFFNGSLYPISLRDMSGSISFSNGSEVRKLDGRITMRPQLSAENCRRHQSGNFMVRQELSSKDVEFISTATYPSGRFLLDELAILVEDYIQTSENKSTARLTTQGEDVQLRSAFRHDAAAREARRRRECESRLSRIRYLSEVIGRSRELIRIHNSHEFMPLEDMKHLAHEMERSLYASYGNEALQVFYPFKFKGDRLERPDEYAHGRAEWFRDYFNQLVILEEKEESDTLANLAKTGC